MNFLYSCLNACMQFKSMEAVRVLEYCEHFKKLVGKLPFHLHDRWRSIVLQTKDDRGDTVTFSQLVDFVKKEAKKAKDPTFGRDAIVTDYKEPERRGPRSSATSQRAKGSFATSVSEPMQNSHRLHAPSAIYVKFSQLCRVKTGCSLPP